MEIQSAIERGAPENVPHQFTAGLGRIARVFLNDLDLHDEGISHIAQAIRHAANEVCAQFYIFDPTGPAGHEFLQALAESQTANPQLKAFIAINSIFSQADKVQAALSEYGITAELSVHSIFPTRGSLHSKVVVIDGRDAFIGGNNIDNPEESDVTLLVKGSIVDSLLLEFDDAFSKGNILSVNKPSSAAELLRSHALNPPNIDPGVGDQLIQIVAKDSNRNLFSRLDSPANRAILQAIDIAQSEIKLTSPNFNQMTVWNHLSAAIDRGISVKLLVPRDYLNLASFIDSAPNRSLSILWRNLTPEQQAKFQIRWFSIDGKSTHPTHSKAVIIDDSWAYIGSQNTDCQSWGFSREVGLGITDPTVVKSLAAAVFDSHWATGIPLKAGWLSSLLLSPTNSFIKRCARYLIPPFAIGEWAHEKFGRLFQNSKQSDR
jgi:phosphatidylserine/phosphatidylglycerophosphate/cardiolipin synthase-like enzyme